MRITSLSKVKCLVVTCCTIVCLSPCVVACVSHETVVHRTIPPEAIAALGATVEPSATAPRPTQPVVAPSVTQVLDARATAPSPTDAIGQVTRPPEYTPTPNPTPAIVMARVVEVIDGDSMIVEMDDGQCEIGYWGCVVPEDLSEWQRDQCTSANRVLLSCGEVRLEPDPLAEIMGVNRYNVWHGETLLNLELVRMGYARASQYLTGSRYERDILDTQALAQNAGLGIWAAPPATLTPLPTSEPTVDGQSHEPPPTEQNTEPTASSTGTSRPEPTDEPLPTAIPYAEATPVPPSATPVPATPEPSSTAEPPTVAPTSEPTSEPTAIPLEATQAPSSVGSTGMLIAIIDVFYDGIEGRAEPDEYCEIANQGDASVAMEGWRLNAGANGQDFVFPAMVLEPGQICRVYTNELHEEWGGLMFASGSALWKNSGDCGYLYDAEGNERDSYCYD